MRKRKSLHGFLGDPENPVSMEEIIRELKEDRKKDDESVVRDFLGIVGSWEKYCDEKQLTPSFNEYVKWLLAHC
ncbi:MAG: hypothetical protein AABW68_02715 [archaeon]